MRKIKLTQNKYALVDNEDFHSLNQYKWYASKEGHTFYATRVTKNPKGSKVRQARVKMHRVIMKTPVGMETDHIDKNGLNNQRSNLRICTKAENRRNQTIYKNNTSGFKGVSFIPNRNKWRAAITLNRKNINLGDFKAAELADEAYKEASIKYHGAFSRVLSASIAKGKK